MDWYDNFMPAVGMALFLNADNKDYSNMSEAEKEDWLNRAKDEGKSEEEIEIIKNEASMHNGMF